MTAGSDRRDGLDPAGARNKLLGLLDTLQDSPAGELIYRQVESMLEDLTGNHIRSEIAYAGFINVLLEAFNAHQPPGTPEHVQIRLLQARLQPPLTTGELEVLSGFIEQCGDRIRNATEPEPTLLVQAVSPLLEAFGIETASLSAPAPADAATGITEGTVGQPAGGSAAQDAVDASADEPLGVAATSGDLSEIIPAGQDLNAINRSELESRREDIAKLQATLADQVLDTISQNEEFGTVLENVLGELRQASDSGELENLRWNIIREIEKMLSGHNNLADKLDSTHHYLQLFETDSRELSNELTRVRLLSLTDELTGLPNRRAFVRRLEDEVARVQRYGFPLSFVLIDLDHFKSINDKYGHSAGDEVLRVYSKNILSIFRHHDMVARYGGEEFAVLLPNTDSDGTVRALNKVRRRANETRWQTNGTVTDVPTFSAGVSLYKPGESAAAFIERADKALYRAKRLGRNRIELDMTYHRQSAEDAPRRRSSDA